MLIQELRDIQQRLDLCDEHLVEVREQDFTIAHTDEERASDQSLEECELHTWLTELDRAPCSPGLYIAFRHEPDAYSEPYGADPWDLEPLPSP